MPRVTIELLEGRTLDQKRAAAKAITAAIVEAFGVTPDRVTIKFDEHTKENTAKGGILRIDEK